MSHYSVFVGAGAIVTAQPLPSAEAITDAPLPASAVITFDAAVTAVQTQSYAPIGPWCGSLFAS